MIQPTSYRHSVASPAERLDAMIITNGAFKLMREWADGPLVREYSLSSDCDDRWRAGGSVAEVIEEAHLDEAHILPASSGSQPTGPTGGGASGTCWTTCDVHGAPAFREEAQPGAAFVFLTWLTNRRHWAGLNSSITPD
jgi:hypothetical protein